MPPKADPRDWDRLFRPNAPRRGGPLRALSNLLIAFVVLGLLGGAAFFALRFGLDRARQAVAMTQVAIETNNAQVLAQRTAAAERTASAIAAATAAATPTAAPETLLGRGSVVAGGNLRSAPEVSPETVIGQICPGDQVDFLEQATAADGAIWYRIRVTQQGQNCSAQQVTVGSLGWASSTLLSPPAP